MEYETLEECRYIIWSANWDYSYYNYSCKENLIVFYSVWPIYKPCNIAIFLPFNYKNIKIILEEW